MEFTHEKRLKLGVNARMIVENGKGIFAADESEPSIAKRFAKYNIENTIENRRRFRQIFVTTRDVYKELGGIILHEETFAQKTDGGKNFIDILHERNIAVGIKLDKGLIDFNYREKISVGLEDLDKRLGNEKYKKAIFAKWRSVFSIDCNTPTDECISENCDVLARYALICQLNGIVPIVEPEILFDGNYSIQKCKKVGKKILSTLIQKLNHYDVYLPGILIKPSFICSGKDYEKKSNISEVAAMTFAVLIDTIPVSIPGVVFLSGGHSSTDATMFLDAINKESGQRTWKASFSFGRAISDSVMQVWDGKEENVTKAQQVFRSKLKDCYLAAMGQYKNSKN